MRLELQKQKVKVKFIAINASNASSEPNQKALTDKCSFPIFQDTEKVKAWLHQSGKKDDFYIYDSKGKLAVSLPFDGSIKVDLSSEEGYKNLKEQILKVK